MQDARASRLDVSADASDISRQRCAISHYTGDPRTIQQALQADPTSLFRIVQRFASTPPPSGATCRRARIDRKASALASKMNARERDCSCRDCSPMEIARRIARVRLDPDRVPPTRLLSRPRTVTFSGDALISHRIAGTAAGSTNALLWYVLGSTHSAGECNQYAKAERSARRALELQPRDGWAGMRWRT